MARILAPSSIGSVAQASVPSSFRCRQQRYLRFEATSPIETGPLAADDHDANDHKRHRPTATQVKSALQFGQIYPAPAGDLKQPTDSGRMCFGSQRTAPGTKIVNAIVPKKIT